MITKPTVFILGAGASHPYGFPLGRELLEKVCLEALRPGDQLIAMAEDPDECAAEVYKTRIALARSRAPSLDQFIATRGDERFLLRRAIALTLCRFEREKELFFAGAGDWFRYLWTHLVTHTDSSGSGTTFGGHNVSFVTLNYERSVEHALWHAAKHTYNLLDADVRTRTPPVFHVYGALGNYPFVPRGDSLEFGFQPTRENIEAAAKKIKAVSQWSDADLHDAVGKLKKAKQVVFLGVGFEPATMDLLGFERSGNQTLDSDCHVYATGYGLHEGEQVRARERLRNTKHPAGLDNLTLGGDNMDCLDFLRSVSDRIFG